MWREGPCLFLTVANKNGPLPGPGMVPRCCWGRSPPPRSQAAGPPASLPAAPPPPPRSARNCPAPAPSVLLRTGKRKLLGDGEEVRRWRKGSSRTHPSGSVTERLSLPRRSLPAGRRSPPCLRSPGGRRARNPPVFIACRHRGVLALGAAAVEKLSRGQCLTKPSLIVPEHALPRGQHPDAGARPLLPCLRRGWFSPLVSSPRRSTQVGSSQGRR